MHYLDERNILLFLLQFAILLGSARILGELFRRIGQPVITAEILVGVLLGPTLLGRLAPHLHQTLFPSSAVQQTMLDTVAWLGILFFLLHTGLDTNFAAAWRQKGQAILISFSDLVLPMVFAFIPMLLLHRAYALEGGPTAWVFALFLSTIMTISALPVTARILQDLRMYRTDLGLLIMSALTINDVVGWVLFALILGVFTEASVSALSIVQIFGGTLVFSILLITLGRWLVNRMIVSMNRIGIPEPASSLTLICVLGLLAGAITTWIGIHALFGFFLAGIAIGETRALPERTRAIFAQLVEALLVPVFFASIALKIDFFARFDFFLMTILLVIGVSGRYAGAWLGAAFARHQKASRVFIGLAHLPGGEMQIVIGLLALEYGVISEVVFVAVVVSALLSSMLTGPFMKHSLKHLRRLDWTEYLHPDTVLADLPADSRDFVIHEMSAKAAARAGMTPAAIETLVIRRENDMTTALDGGVAVPHARPASLANPVIVVARTRTGVDWNSRDGDHVRWVFLVLTPSHETEEQLVILQGISRAMSDDEFRLRLEKTRSPEEIITCFHDGPRINVVRVVPKKR